MKDDLKILYDHIIETSDIRQSKPKKLPFALPNGIRGYVNYKSVTEWLSDFIVSFENYCKSIYDDPTFDLLNWSKQSCSVGGNEIGFILLNFAKNSYLYTDEFDDIIINTDNFVSFIKTLKELHPGIDIPAFCTLEVNHDF